MIAAIGRGIGRSQRGFTLLELLVVLGIVALALALVVPSFNRARFGLIVRSAAHELAANLRDARTAAQADNLEHAMVFDLVRRRYWAEGVVAPRQVPPTLAVELAVPDSERLGETGARVRFLPDGGSSGARIVLGDGKATATVSVDWLTGDVRLQWGP